jgi:hypothetical protein
VTTIPDGHVSVQGSEQKFVCSPKHSHWLCDPNSLQSSGYQRPLPWK